MSNFVNPRRRLKSVSALAAGRRRPRPNPLLIEHLEDRTVLSTITWNSAQVANGGSWDVASNWIGGVVPGPNDDAVINLNSGTVNVNGALNDSVNSVTTNSGAGLTISNGGLSIASASTLGGPLNITAGGTLSGAGTVTVNGPLVWTGGTMSGTGTTDAKANLTIGTLAAGQAGTVYLNGGRTLVNRSIGNFQGPAGASATSQIYIQNASTFVNKSTGTLNFLGTVAIGGDGSVGSGVVNQGILNANAASAPDAINAPFLDSGVLNLQGGTLALGGGGIFSGTGPTVTTASGTVLDLTGGTFTSAAGTTLTVSGSGLTRLSGGTLTFAGNASLNNFTETIGTLGGSGKFTVTSQFNWQGGSMTGPGITENRGTLTMGTTAVNGYFQGFISAGRSLNNYGNATLATGLNYGVAYGLYVQDGSTITNAAGANFNFNANATINDNGGFPDGGTFINLGTLGTTGGAGRSYINIPITNSGTIKTQVGTLVLNAGGSFLGTASVLNESSGAILNLGNGIFTADAGTSFSGIGAGVVQLDNATLNLTGSASIANFTQNSGTLSGTGTLTVTGTLAWTGGTQTGTGITDVQGTDTLGSTASGTYPVLFLAGGRQFNNNAAGTLSNPAGNGPSNGIYLSDGSTFTIKAGGSLYITSPASFNSNGGTPNGGTLVNLGTLGTNGTSTNSYINIPVNNSGTIDIQAGTLSLGGGGTFSGTASTLNVASGADLDFADGTFTAAAGTVITGTGAGIVELSGGTFNLAGTANLVNYLQSNGTLTGTGSLTTSGLLTWNVGTMSGTGTTEAKAALSIGNYAFLTGGRSLINDAAATVNPAALGYSSAYGLWVGDGSTITNKPGATFTFQSNATINDNGGTPDGGTFINLGTIAANGDVTGTNINIPVSNSGTISVVTGNLQLNAGGTFIGTASTLTTAANTILKFANGTTTSALGTVITGTGAGVVQLIGGTATLNGTTNLVNFTETGGTLGGTGTVTVSGILAWIAGTMSGTGTTEALTTLNIGYYDFLTGGRSLINDVSATVDPASYGYSLAYGLWVQDGSTITNKAGATFTFVSDSTITDNGGSPDGGTFINLGTIAANGDATGTNINIPVSNSGTISVVSGNLKLNSGATFTGTASTLTTAANTILNFNNGSVTSATGTVITGTGAGVVQLGGATATLNGTTNLVNFTETAGTLGGTGAVTVSGVLNWVAGFMTGTGTTEALTSLSIGYYDFLTGGRSLINDTAATVNPAAYGYGPGYGIWVQDGSTITNKAGATFTFLSDANTNNNGGTPDGGTFINYGTLANNGGTTTSNINIALANYGTINVQTATLALNGGGTFNGTGSTLIESASATLLLGNGTFTAAAGTTITGSGAGIVQMGGGTATLNGTTNLTNFTETGGTLGGSGAVTVSGVLNWVAGVITGTGTIEAVSSLKIGYADFLQGGRSLINDAVGIINPSSFGYGASYGLWLQDGSTITNKPGATLTFASDASISNNGGTPTGGSIINQGTLVNNGGTTTTTISIPVTNTGTISVQTGTLNLTGGLTNFNAANSTLTGGTYIVKTTFQFANAKIVTNNAAITLNTGVSSIRDSNGNSATPAFAAIGASGSLTLLGGRSLTVGTFSNAGVLTVTTGSTFKTNSSYTQTGGATVLTGGSLVSGTNVININAGTLRGVGTVTGNVTNAGTVQPGGAGVAGLLTVTGNYTQTAAGSLLIDIGGTTVGTQYDRLAVSGTATLAGTLGVSFINGYLPAAATSFQPLTFASQTGDFTTKNGLDLGDRILPTVYTATALNLVTNFRPVTTAPTPAIGSNGVATVTLTATDTESPASSLVFTITSLPAGTLYYNGSVVTLGTTITGSPATLTYVIPTAVIGNFNDSFKYTVTDNGVPPGTAASAATSQPATVNLTLTAPSAGVVTVSGTLGNDTIVVGSSGGNLQVTVNGVVSTTTIPLASITQLNVYGQTGNDGITLNGLAVNTNLVAGPGIDSLFLNGTAGANTFTINAATVGFNGATITGNIPLTVNAIGGPNIFNIVAPNATASLNGGSGTNSFVFSAGASLAGTITGGTGTNTIDETAVTNSITLNLATSSLTGIANGFSNIQSVLAGTNAANSLIGPATGTTFNITASNTGNAAGVAFSGFANITGGAGNNSFVFSNAAKITGALNGGVGGTNTINDSAYTTSVTTNLITNKTTGVGTTFSNIQAFVGSATVFGVLTGPSAGSTYNITAPNTSNVNGLAFSNYSSYVAGAGNDVFKFSAGATVAGSVNGGAGTNTIDLSSYTTATSINIPSSRVTGVGGTFNSIQTIIGGSNKSNSILGPNTATVFNITGANAGVIGSLNFSGFGNLTGGTANNSYVFSAGATLSGAIVGGSATNTINESAYTTPVALNLASSTITGIGTTFSGIQNFIGGTAANTLTGPAAGSTFNITGPNAGTVGTTSFTNFGSLTGGVGNDAFVFANTGSLSGAINGGAGANTIDQSALGTAVALNLTSSTLTAVGSTVTGVQTFIGSTTAGGTLTGPAAASTFNITGLNAGNVGGVAFSNYGNLVGGAGTNVFKFAAAGSLSGGITGGSGANSIDETAFTTPVSLNLATSTLTGLGASYSNIQTITPGSGANTLTGPATGSTFNITVANTGNVAGFNFTNFGSLVGGPGNDTFKFATGGTLSGSINGGGGSDTIDQSALTTAVTLNLATSTINSLTGSFSNIQNILGGTSSANQIVGPATGTTFNITGANLGNAAGVSWTGFGNITGGVGNDVFKFSNAATLSGSLNGGGGTDTVDLSAYTTATSLNIPSSRFTGLSGNFSAIQSFVGGSSGSNAILGPNAASVFNITGTNAGNVGGIGFTAFGNLVGGPANDSFVFSAGASLSGNLNGGTGTNTVDYSAYTTSVSLNLASSRATGLGGTYSSVQNFIGGSNSANAIAGPAAATTFNITGANAGNVGGIGFTAFGNLVGGAANDRFVFSAGASLTGNLNGGAGSNTIDMSAYTTAVSVNLASSRATGLGGSYSSIQTFIGGTNASNAVAGPASATTFNITALNTFNANGLSFSNYGTIIGGASQNQFVLGNGAGLSGTINGGVGGKNWLDYSAYTTGITVNLTTGAATGFGKAISNIYNVRGGIAGTDVLTGNSKGNILIGGGGTNTITGGTGVSLLIGGTGQATINGGSGGDLIIGGSTTLNNTNAALDSILAEWQSSDSYATRINFIKNGGGLNGTNQLNLGTTVIDNLAANVLTGAAGGKNWYFKGANTTITNLQPGEQVN